MSGGAVIMLGIVAIVVICIIGSEIKRSGYHEAFTKLEKEYGSVNAFKQKALNEIEQERKRFIESRNATVSHMRKQARIDILHEEQENIRALKRICDAEIRERQNKAHAILNEIHQEVEDFRITHSHVFSVVSEFERGYINGRKWIADAASSLAVMKFELNKLQRARAPKTTEIHSNLKKEYKELRKKYHFLEMQLASYKEYFPFLDDYEEAILDESIQIDLLSEGDDSKVDRAHIYLNKNEYDTLSNIDKYQLALDRYNKRTKSKWEIGRCYERYIGYLYEKDGWDVTYFGATQKLKDMGRDLICKKDTLIHIIQAKCWSKEKTIHEKHIFQLFGSTLLYEIEHHVGNIIQPVFITTTSLSDVAFRSAEWLGVEVRNVALNMDYPMIKCNIGKGNDKIYHLPFDQQYDKIKIDRKGECYTLTVEEAEQLGFRRAKRHFGG